LTPERLAQAYALFFPSRLRKAHLALVAYAEGANADGWPTPDDVHRFARMYGVPRAQLGALVGLLSRTEHGIAKPLWTDAVRGSPSPHLIARHSQDVLRAFGWFCATTDLGWLKLKEPTLH